MISKTFPALGTVNTITAECDDDILEKIKQYTFSLHKKLNVFDEQSEITEVNRSGGEPVKICSEAREIIESSVRISDETNGTFDITALPLIKLWKNAKQYPSGEEISAAKELVNYRNVIIDKDTVKLKNKGMGIDLGGIAKGFAADTARDFLIENGVENAVVDFGGTVIVSGEERVVGIQNPFEETGKIIGTVRVRDKAVVTSGSYEQFLTLEGRKVHHIIDPQSGYPSNSGIVEVTLIGDCAMELDALATGIFVLGAQKGLEIMRKKEIEGIFVDENGSVYTTKNLRNNFEVARH